MSQIALKVKDTTSKSATSSPTLPKIDKKRPKKITDLNSDLSSSFKTLTMKDIKRTPISGTSTPSILKSNSFFGAKKKYDLQDVIIEKTLGTGSFGRVH